MTPVSARETIACGLLIAGGGPAGLSAAVAAAAANPQLRIIVAEGLPSCGRKLLASGAGKCNVTNKLDAAGMAERFRCGSRFVKPALHAFPPERLREFLRVHGVETVAPDGFHYFPASLRAGDVLDVFLNLCRGNPNIRIIPDCMIDRLLLDESGLAGAEAQKYRFITPRVMLACGGLGYPDLGGKGSGYRLAEQAGHVLAKPVPALVGLQCAEAWMRALPGVIVPDALVILGKLSGRGELIFTHSGISGPAVLDLSGTAARLLEERRPVTLRCSWIGIEPQQGAELLREWQLREGKKTLRGLMARMLPKALAFKLAEVAGIGETPAARMSAGLREALQELLFQCPIPISGTDGWKKAMATDGGVPFREIATATLHSRRCNGLYLAGEMIDVGAPCGGYNLQWAFSSGRLAGKSAASP